VGQFGARSDRGEGAVKIQEEDRSASSYGLPYKRQILENARDTAVIVQKDLECVLKNYIYAYPHMTWVRYDGIASIGSSPRDVQSASSTRPSAGASERMRFCNWGLWRIR
jgi:hypothetical protein